MQPTYIENKTTNFLEIKTNSRNTALIKQGRKNYYVLTGAIAVSWNIDG